MCGMPEMSVPDTWAVKLLTRRSKYEKTSICVRGITVGVPSIDTHHEFIK